MVENGGFIPFGAQKTKFKFKDGVHPLGPLAPVGHGKRHDKMTFILTGSPLALRHKILQKSSHHPSKPTRMSSPKIPDLFSIFWVCFHHGFNCVHTHRWLLGTSSRQAGARVTMSWNQAMLAQAQGWGHMEIGRRPHDARPHLLGTRPPAGRKEEAKDGG